MATAVNEFRTIKQHAEIIKNDETHRIETCSPGDSWAQGDLLIVALDAVPKNCKPTKVERQLAPGTSQGSRHFLASLEGVEMFTLDDATPLDGPIVKTAKPCEIEHPEHGNIVLPAGVYGVIYQRQYAEELRRVVD